MSEVQEVLDIWFNNPDRSVRVELYEYREFGSRGQVDFIACGYCGGRNSELDWDQMRSGEAFPEHEPDCAVGAFERALEALKEAAE